MQQQRYQWQANGDFLCKRSCNNANCVRTIYDLVILGNNVCDRYPTDLLIRPKLLVIIAIIISQTV